MAHRVDEMGRAHTSHEAHCSRSARRYSYALLLSAITGLLVACGGGGVEPAASSVSSTNPNTATLAWEASTEPNLAGYRIYYGTAPGTYLQSPGQGVNVGNVTSYTVTGLSRTTTYYFVATAYDTSNSESIFSNEVSKAIP